MTFDSPMAEKHNEDEHVPYNEAFPMNSAITASSRQSISSIKSIAPPFCDSRKVLAESRQDEANRPTPTETSSFLSSS